MKAYELRTYEVAEGKMEPLRSVMRDVMVPLMREYAMEAIAFFALPDNSGVYWLVQHESLDVIASDWDRFHADQRWKHAIRERTQGNSFLTGEQSIPLTGMAGLPPRLEADNMATIGAYADGLFRRKDFSVIDRYVAPDFVQHNPHAPDGIQGVKVFAEHFIAGNPDLVAEGRRFAADGDYVFVHSLFKTSPQERGSSLVDIFRLQDGRIAEHWDVMQEIPAETTSGNAMV